VIVSTTGLEKFVPAAWNLPPRIVIWLNSAVSCVKNESIMLENVAGDTDAWARTSIVCSWSDVV
jgi:hypothetical protein